MVLEHSHHPPLPHDAPVPAFFSLEKAGSRSQTFLGVTVSLLLDELQWPGFSLGPATSVWSPGKDPRGSFCRGLATVCGSVGRVGVGACKAAVGVSLGGSSNLH